MGGTTTSAGGMSGAGGMGTTTTGSGGNTNSCVHDVCTLGPALTIGCGDTCVDIVCNDDDFCCDSVGGEWDDLCVESAVNLCGASCSGGGSVLPGDLVITEIMNNPAVVADAAGEWFEVLNDSGASIDLQGLVIRHQSIAADPNATVSISQSVVIAAGDYAVLGLNGNMGTNGGVVVDFVYPAAVNLSNTSDYLAIEDGSGTVIDEVTYNESSGLDPNGKSRSLNPLFTSASNNNDDTHFCEATSLISGGDAGTPGSANDSCP